MARPRAKSSAARAAARPAATPKSKSGARASKQKAAGRPTKYTAAVHRRIVKACRDGNYRSIAFRLAGIHEDTGFEWLKLGRGQPAAHPDFARLELDILRAEAAFEADMVSVVAKEALKKKPGSWLPAMTFLERTRPQRYARRDTTVLEGGESPIQVLTHAVIADPEARELSRSLLRRVAAPRAELAGGAGVGDEPSESGG